MTVPVPWIPTEERVIKYVIELLKASRGKVIAELGCGDGRIAIALAKAGSRVLCIELRRELARKARQNIRKEGVNNLVTVIEDDFTRVPLNNVDGVYAYLTEESNVKLKHKLESELKDGARVVTLDFPILGWEPAHVIIVTSVNGGRPRTLFLYIKGKL